MVRIDKYITDLLYVYDCVVIPGFGGFVGNYSPARIQSGQNRFFPPYKQLAFNVNLKTNDGLLANHIANNEDISFIEANKLISQFVDYLNLELSTKRKVEIEEVGFFKTDKEATLHFEQNMELNFLLQSFGLAEFDTPAIKKENPLRDKFSKKIIDRSVITSESPRVRLKKYWALAASLPLGIFIGVSLFVPELKHAVSNSSASLISFDKEIVSSYLPRETYITISAASIEEIEEMEPVFLIRSEPHPVSEIIAPSVNLNASESAISTNSNASTSKVSLSKYHIIGGCFSVEENAEKLINELAAKGFSPYLLDKKNGLSRVSFGAYASKDKALLALESVKNNHNANAWLLIQ